MLDEIVTIVRQAGDMLLQARDVESVTAEKHGAADLVTSYDLAVQDLLRRRLLALLPEADFLGEEGEHEALTKPWIFVADPIDGTANFVHDMHYSNVSVALVHEGVTEYAAVCDPYRGEVYAARRGGGAFCNGRPMAVSTRDADHAIVLCGSTIYDPALTERHFSVMRKLYDRCADYRRFGAAALDLCQIAAGRAEIFFECRLRPWDFAAASLLITEAGGSFTTLEGGAPDVLRPGSVFASNARCRGIREELELGEL